MAVHEVTVGQFQQFVNASNYKTQGESEGTGAEDREAGILGKLDPRCTWRNPLFDQNDEHPVVCVSWNDAVAFCNWLSENEKRIYRLPTEAEWEYCCRAGTAKRYPFGSRDADLKSAENIADLKLKRGFRIAAPAWCQPWNDGFAFTAPVGRFKRNAFGLYDLLGNAAEWCADWQGDYPTVPVDSPTGSATGTYRVIRGGSWYSSITRASTRYARVPNQRTNDVGFRVVCELPGPAGPGKNAKASDFPKRP
jgi:formylglycine-generating enzyme required for sulfatase activity